MKKNKGIIEHIHSSKFEYKKSGVTLGEFTDIVKEAMTASNKSMPTCIAGVGGKDLYVEHCLRQGISMDLINLSIKDNGDGTFTLGPLNIK